MQGQFKQHPNLSIRVDFTLTLSYLVPSALMAWINNLDASMDATVSDADTVLAICRQHIAFEHIHPFSDGNERVGRTLIVYSCHLAGLTLIVIPVYQRKECINYLNTEDLEGFAAFAEILQSEERKRIEAFS